MRRRAGVAALVLVAGLGGAAVTMGIGRAAGGSREAGDFFRRGNEAYESGDYSGAVLLYRQIIEAGEESAALRYNLGNAYLKLGELGEAMASYLRAERLNPRDRDIRENLSIARARRADLPPGDGLSPLAALRSALTGALTLCELLLLADIFYGAAAICLVLLALERGRRWARRALAVTAPVAVLALGFFFWEYAARERTPAAVLVLPQAEARSGPGPDYTAEFTLHEGAELVVEGERGDWCVVRFGPELRGWLERKALEKIS